jgi:hypothetical protein
MTPRKPWFFECDTAPAFTPDRYEVAAMILTALFLGAVGGLLVGWWTAQRVMEVGL